LAITEGEMVEVESRRGKLVEPAKIGGIQTGLVFIPFHYGYWDEPGRARAANELTLSEWDPISKQPHFKYSAVKIRKAGQGVLKKIENAIEKVVETIDSKF
jgi:ferredoxin-nitrate reductase